MNFMPLPADAAQITARSVVLGSSAVSTSTTYNFTFTLPTATTVKSVKFLFCDSAASTCTPGTAGANGIPAGINTNTASLSGSSNLGGAGTWTVDGTPSQGQVIISNASNTGSPSAGSTVNFSSITNPSTTNTTFYIRIFTYDTASAGGTQLDTGTVATSTANQVTVNATVDESLTFCVGDTLPNNNNCTGVTNNAVTLQTATSTNPTSSATAFGTSQFGASTNAESGYVVTISGNTLTSGSNTITALATQTASSAGAEQFGLNLVDNATPNVGSAKDGPGAEGNEETDYDDADQFRFVSGDTIAHSDSVDPAGSDPDPTDFNRFTVSYIANISGLTEAGSYTTTLTFVCTATF